MSGRCVSMLGLLGLGVIGLGVVGWALRRWTVGDIDPLGGAIGLMSGLVGVASLVVAVRSWRLQQAGTEALAGQLATAVLVREQQARQQLLGEAGRAIDVGFDFHPAPAHDAEQAHVHGRLSEVAAYYRRLQPRRMVITGAAGAGKTVLAVELIMMLLKDRAPEDPVPVRLSASSWDLSAGQDEPAAAGNLMQQWLITHLVEVYRMSRRSATALVEADGVLPVVDGLDELDATDEPGYASRAGRALRVFNGYQRYRDKGPLIVTCRSGHYQALTAERSWVEDAVRVEIRPVNEAQARAFITARAIDASRWRPVLERIDRDRDGPLAGALATPWRLTLATVVYEQRDSAGSFLSDPHELTGPGLNTPDKVRDHLLGLFLTAALQNTPAQPYDPARAHCWLAVLAGYLADNTDTGRSIDGRPLSGTDIVLHELWPLAGFVRPRLAVSATIAAIWLALVGVMPPKLPNGPAAVFAMLIICWLGCIYASWTTLWPSPRRLSLDWLRASRGHRLSADRIAICLVWALCSGFSAAAVVARALGGEDVFHHTTYFLEGLKAGFAPGFVFGLLLILLKDVGVGTPDPRSIVRDDLTTGLVFGLVIGLAGGLANGLAIGLLFGPVFGFMFGHCGFRYLALLLCTRRWNRHPLPWRLGRFLDDCYRVGLVRLAGSGYQFRHSELQDYLARHPAP